MQDTWLCGRPERAVAIGHDLKYSVTVTVTEHASNPDLDGIATRLSQVVQPG